MKVLLIVHSVSWKGGGAFFHALHIAKGLKKRGNNVDIICTSENSYFRIIKKEIDGINLVQFPDLLFGQARNGWDLYNTLRRIIYLFKNKYDIVHLLDTRPVVIFPGIFSKYFRNSKLVIEWLDWFGKGGTASERNKFIKMFMEPIETFFEEKFRRYADGSIGLGVPLTKRIIEYAPNVPYITITHGCDTDSLKAFDLTTCREELNLNKDAYYLGYTGRMREDVITRLVSLIRILKNSVKGKKIYCILIGNPAFNVDNYLDEEIKENFIKTGWIEYSDVNKYMSACNVLLLPFNSNSVARKRIWPSKINDYLSVGRPIISTELNVLVELFNKEQIGFMVADDVEKIAEKCISIFENNELAKEYSVNARKLAETTYNWNTIVDNINRFYLELL